PGDYESHLETRASSKSRARPSSPGPLEVLVDTKRKTRQSDIRPGDFYSTSSNPRCSDRHGTRASTRVASQPLPRERAPSPIRWTEHNPAWAANWKTSIVYPQQGKN